MKRTTTLLAALVALGGFGGTVTVAETRAVEDTMPEAQAFLASPTSLSQSIAIAEQAAGGKVACIEFRSARMAGRT